MTAASRFPARRIAITGAASGLGRALALHYGHAGWRVACLDIQERALQDTVDAVRAAGGVPWSARLDVCSDADFARVAGELNAAWGGLDVLVNNAGIASMGPLLDASMAEWHRLIAVNLLGVVRGCATFGRWLSDAGSGHIVNVASMAGLASAPGMATYGVTKAAVVALSEQLRAELAARNVGVTLVCPSFFATNLLDSMDGPAQAKARISRWMQNSEVDAAAIARMIAESVEINRFLLIPHRKALASWRFKRYFPERYFRKVQTISPR
jgi:NAD(P)-dependent dehydrogenase (short-subunit alcohol dehydrogenase family)